MPMAIQSHERYKSGKTESRGAGGGVSFFLKRDVKNNFPRRVALWEVDL